MGWSCDRLRREVGKVEIPALIEMIGQCLLEQGKELNDIISDVRGKFGEVLDKISQDNDQTRDEIVAGVNRDIAASQGVIQGAIGQSENNIKRSLADAESRINANTNSAIGGITTGISQSEGRVKQALGESERRLDQKIGGISGQIDRVKGDLERRFNEGVSQLSDRIGNAESNIIGSISGTIRDTLGGLGGAIDRVVSAINGTASALSNAVKGALTSIGSLIGSAITGARDNVAQVITAVRGFIDRLIVSLREAWTRAGDFLRDLPTETGKLLREWIGPQLDQWLADANRGADYISGKVSRLMRCGYGSFDAFVADVADVPDGPVIARLLTNALIGAGVVLAGAPTAAGPYLECIANMARADALSTNVDPNVIGLLATRGIIDQGRANAEAARLGLTGERMALYTASQRPVVDMSAIIRANYLKIISDEEARGFASRIGFSNSDYDLQKAAAKSLLDPSRVVHAVFRGVWGNEQAQNELEKHGLSNEQINAIAATNRPFLDRTEIRDAYLREVITAPDHDARLMQMGFTEQDALLIRNLYFFIPPPSDLIRMAVRDVFSPEIAQRFGLFDEFPTDFLEWAKKQGISEEWARNYWGAHWSLPSPQQGFAMFQRRIITNEELRDLLKAQDLTPFWRDKMRDLAYNPLTRVDTRRMYETGVIDRNEVYESYLDQGYSPDNAERLTKFTEKFGVTDEESVKVEERELTRSVIERAYKRNILTREEAISQLIAIRYNRQTADLLLQIVDYDNADNSTVKHREKMIDDTVRAVKRAYGNRAMGRQAAINNLLGLGFTAQEANMMILVVDYDITAERKETLTNIIRTAYIERTIDMNEAIDWLSRNDFSSGEMQELLAFWHLFRSFRVRKLSLSQLTTAVKKGVIQVEDLVGEMRGEGYNDRHIHTYTEMVFGVRTGGGINQRPRTNGTTELTT